MFKIHPEWDFYKWFVFVRVHVRIEYILTGGVVWTLSFGYLSLYTLECVGLFVTNLEGVSRNLKNDWMSLWRFYFLA